MDTGVNRKLANLVPVYLQKVAGEGGHARFDSVANTERAINLRFKYASRRLRVPHVYPGYYVVESVKQATLTGSEHRRALRFLPFAVVGVVGPHGDSDEHRAVLRCICELVALTNALFDAQHTAGITLSEAAVLAQKAHEWVVDHFQPLLGPVHDTKLHRLSAHLLDEFRLRGNVFDGNSACNESLHKAVKAAYKTTNRKRGQFIEQLILNEQVNLVLKDEAGLDSELSDRSGAGDDFSTRSTAPRQQVRRGRRRLRQRYSRKESVGRLSEKRNLPGLADALACDAATTFCVRSSLYFGPSDLLRGRQYYTIRASPNFHGSPWWDWVRYRGQDGETRVGQASLVVGNRAGTWQRLVVRRTEPAAAHEGCVLTTYGCERLRWSVGLAEACVSLDVLRADEDVSWLAVEHDWEDLSTRHGVTVMPDEVPTTADELRAARFFVNAFVGDATANEGGEGAAGSEDDN